MVSSMCLFASLRTSDVNYRVFKQGATWLFLPVSLADFILHRLDGFLYANYISSLIISA